MKSPNKKQLSNMYNKSAYDYLCSADFTEVYEHAADFLIKKSSQSILDVGCWNGMFLKNLLKQGYDNKYIGFDLCSEAIQEALKKYNGIKDIEFHTKSWYEMFNNKSFDSIYFGGVFYYIDDKISFINKYIESYNPRLIVIQDLQITDLSCFNVFSPNTKKFSVDIDVNIERKNRQVITFEL
jgi:SAM-dependent methyltransferase